MYARVDWRIFADFAQHLIGLARPLHDGDPMSVDLDHNLYGLDSTTITRPHLLASYRHLRHSPWLLYGWIMVVMPSRKPTSQIVTEPLQRQTRGKTVGKTKSRVGRAKTISLDGNTGEMRVGKPAKAFHLKFNKAKRTETAFTIPARLMKHAVDTFGSEKVARVWLSTECGVLNNQTPAAFLQSTGNSAEVERILGCIDYGMIA